MRRIGRYRHSAGEYPQTLGGQCVRGRHDCRAVDAPERPVGIHLPFTQVEHALDRTLDQHDVPVPFGPVQGGHVLAFGAERDRRHTRKVIPEVLDRKARLRGDHEHRGLGRVAGDLPPLPVGRQRGVIAHGTGDQRPAQRLVGVDRHRLAVTGDERSGGSVAGSGSGHGMLRSPHLAHRHLVLGERACLVGADHRGPAQRLDRGQPPDDRTPLGHSCDTDGQRDGDRRRQALRDGADRQCDRGGEGLHGVLLAHQAERKGGSGQRQDADRQDLAEPGEFGRQRRGEHLGRTDQAVDLTDLGLRTRGHDDSGSGTGGHQRPGVGHIAAVGHRRGFRQRHLGLVDRHRFPGERGLVDAQFAFPEQSDIGGHLVAGLDQDEVARYQLIGADGAFAALADHLGLGVHHGAQALQGGFGLGLLYESDDGIDHHDGEDDDRIDVLAQRGGHDTGYQQHVDQGMVELAKDPPDQAGASRRGKSVEPELLQAFCGDPVGQPPMRVGLQQQHDLVGGEAVVSVRRHCVRHDHCYSSRCGSTTSTGTLECVTSSEDTLPST